MKKENFTAGRVADFKCAHGKQQTIYWDAKTPGLGLRVTVTGAKSFVFESSLHGKTIRMTIGDPRTWRVGDAQAESTRLKGMTDQGIDPRKVISEAKAADEANAAAQAVKDVRESVTLGDAWDEYLAARKDFWGARHYDDHVKMIHLGGEKRKRHTILTEPGALASLSAVRLVDLTVERVVEWARVEGAERPGRGRLAHRHLKAFLAWCSDHATYCSVVTANSAKNKTIRELLGKQDRLDDVLQREQLKDWFASVKVNCSQIVAVYLQGLLLTGARPNELTGLRWSDVNFKWASLNIRDKVEGERVIPLTPYLAMQLNSLPRLSEWVFNSPNSTSGHLTDPLDAHNRACKAAGITLTLYGLRRSFATLSEWIETPGGIAAQIQGHAPSGVREKHYIRRPLDLLRMWHIKIEGWILREAGIKLDPESADEHLFVELEEANQRGGPEALLVALRHIAEGQGLRVVAERMGIAEECLSRELSSTDNLTIKTLFAVVGAAGLKLSVHR